jgi:hypothetical protein
MQSDISLDDVASSSYVAQKELRELRRQLSVYEADAVHTCGDACQRPTCVLRRERDALAAELKALRAQEPVAWRYQASGQYRYRGYVEGFDRDYQSLKPVKLYAAPVPAQDVPVNQCDGCQAGATLDDNGVHRAPSGHAMMVCQSHRYPVPAQDVARDAERYRWLRDGGINRLKYDDYGVGPSFDLEEELDETIDAAMLAAAQKKEEGQ